MPGKLKIQILESLLSDNVVQQFTSYTELKNYHDANPNLEAECVVINGDSMTSWEEITETLTTW